MSSTTTKTVVTTNKQNNKTNKTSKNRKRRIRKQVRKKAAKTIVVNDSRLISKCVREYASAIVNPFGTRGVMPCIPDIMTIPSMKYQTKSRGVFSTGARGVGFVSLNPWLMARNNGGFLSTSHSFPVTYTTPEYNAQTYTDSVSLGALPVGVLSANSNAMLDDAFIVGGDRQIRLVAAGLKITYSGSNFRNQGRVVLARNQGNIAFDNNIFTSDLLEDNYSVSLPISRRTEYIYYTPDSYILNGYQPFTNYDPTQADSVSRRSLLIMIDGGDVDVPQNWLFEAVAYFELIGPNLTLSRSDSDVEGMGMVVESLPIRAPTSPPKVVEETVMNRVINMAKSKLLEYGPAAAGYGANLLLDRMMGRISMGSATQYPLIEDID